MFKRNNNVKRHVKVLSVQKKKYVIAGMVLLTGIMLFSAVLSLSACSGADRTGYSVGQVDYKNNSIQMTEVASSTENGKISILVSDIIENSIIYTEYNTDNLMIPLMAYVAPSGKLVTAVSICEPCNSRRFFIEDNALVCSACYTRWELEDLKPISGGCLNYPPDAQEYEVEDDSLLLDESLISTWKPRIF
jgi:uncharacterized protein